jgi:sigma-B regulation protein RsbU (phosphoserine phosphatase)
MFKILIIDDDPIIRLALSKTLQNQGYNVETASNGEEGIAQAQRLNPALIICDWVMSKMDGLEVCRQIKANPELASTFFILLTAKGANPEGAGDRVRGLDAGADEFVSKPIDINELKARVRAGLRLHQLYKDLQTQKQDLETLNKILQTQKQILETELAEAAEYVRSLLPSPLVGKVKIQSLFVTSAQLGGDCFDYYWLDDDHLVMYLLDVSGHGVGSALLSVSVLNVLRSQSLPNTNFYQPSEVLKALNNAFPMASHGDKYFTIWYGVYQPSVQQIIYANAGHPPALLCGVNPHQNFEIQKLNSLDLPIGFIPDIEFTDSVISVPSHSTLYIFSDGAYEIHLPDGDIWGYNALSALLSQYTRSGDYNLQMLLEQIISVNQKRNFSDDLSLLQVNFA